MANNKRAFPIDDILAVLTGRFVSERGFEAFYDLLGFLFGERPFTHQIPRFCKICRPHLLRQLPQLSGSDEEVARILEQIHRTMGDQALIQEILASWRRDMTAKFGAQLEVTDLPEEVRDLRDPIEEMTEMRGEPPIIIVDDGDEG